MIYQINKGLRQYGLEFKSKRKGEFMQVYLVSKRKNIDGEVIAFVEKKIDEYTILLEAKEMVFNMLLSFICSQLEEYQEKTKP